MRVRDEAHRFANDFNADLRSRKLRESILDEMPGLGSKRRDALLEAFGSIQKLRKATAEQIAEVDGLSAKLAADIVEYLAKRV
jgi:excinuclease ABC subunit C